MGEYSKFAAANPEYSVVPEKKIPIGDIALDLQSTGLTPAQHLEFGLSLDQKKTLIVPNDTDAFSLASAIDAGGLTYLLVRNDDGSLGAIVDIEWSKSQARSHFNQNIVSFQDLADALFQGKSPSGSSFGHEWLTSISYGRPPLVVCHQAGHHLHLAPQDPCGQP